MNDKNFDSQSESTLLKRVWVFKVAEDRTAVRAYNKQIISMRCVDATIFIIIVIGVNGPLYSVPKRMIKRFVFFHCLFVKKLDVEKSLVTIMLL